MEKEQENFIFCTQLSNTYWVPKALWEICKKKCKGEIEDKTYKETIFNASYDHYDYAILLRSEYYFFNRQYLYAKTEIQRIIKPYTERPLPYKNFSMRGKYEIICDKGKERLVCYSGLKKEVYDLAAEIYAELDDNEKSFQCYKRSRYYSTIPVPDFRGKQCAYIYSFRRISRYTLSDIVTNSITVCNPKLMNDPLDSLYQHWATYGNFKETCQRLKHIKPLVDSYKYFRIRSFVGNKELTQDDSIIRKVTMWSHYADSHKGFCIRYKFSKGMIDHDDEEQCCHYFLKRIKYKDAKKGLDLRRSIMFYDQLFATKSYEWKYENEVRFISYDPTCEEDYLQIKLDLDSQIDAIYFGYRCTDSDIALIKKVAGDKVKYYKMDIDPSNVYRLSIKQM